jgi:hypothetical protein
MILSFMILSGRKIEAILQAISEGRSEVVRFLLTPRLQPGGTSRNFIETVSTVLIR